MRLNEARLAVGRQQKGSIRKNADYDSPSELAHSHEFSEFRVEVYICNVHQKASNCQDYIDALEDWVLFKANVSRKSFSVRVDELEFILASGELDSGRKRVEVVSDLTFPRFIVLVDTNEQIETTDCDDCNTS